ncbi:MAG: putative signal transducing protein [Anaerolineae bacterium]
MDSMTWEHLTDVYGRLEAELLKSYLEAEGIRVEIFQEAVGHHIYPVTLDGLGRVQIFVPKEDADAARTLLEEYRAGTGEASEE